jgi:hypothetical protein
MIRKRKESDNIEVYLFHGWALSPGVWDGLINALKSTGKSDSNLNFNFHLYNRGYFSAEPSNYFSTGTGTTVIVTHSLGLHFVPLSLLHKADFIFVVSGFLNFHKFGGSHTKRIVNKMIEKLKLEPETVLREFYKNMFLPNVIDDEFMKEEIKGINVQRLMDDLNYLNDVIITQRIFSSRSRISLMHGEGDMISSHRHSLNWMMKMNNVSGRIIRHAGHSLPITHSKLISEYILSQVG